MFDAIIQFAARAKADFALRSGRVLEVGSRDVNGTVRRVFDDAEAYIGIDAEAGDGVDRVMPARDIGAAWPPATFDTVICCEMLEHDLEPWVSVEQMHRVLKSGAHLLVSTPTFGFPLHRFPKDYFRFGEDAFREFIFAGFEILRLEEVRDSAGYPCLCCVGRKP